MEGLSEYSATEAAVTADALDARLKRIEAARSGYADSRSNVSEWRQEARLSLSYVAGNQWSPEDIQKMQDEKRPPLTFNQIQRFVDAVVGTEIQNREEVQFTPREPGDVQSSGLLQQAFKWLRHEADAEFEESNAFRDCIITGLGCTGTTIDYVENPDGVVREDRVDPLQMSWPSSANKRNLLDAPELYRTYVLSRNAARAMFPEWEDEEEGRTFANHALGYGIGDYEKERTQIQSTTGDRYKQLGSDHRAGDTDSVMIVERQYWELEPYYRVAFPGRDKPISVSADIYQEMVDEIEDAGGRVEQFHRKRYYKCFYTGSDGAAEDDQEIEHLELADGHPGFSYKFVTGRYDPDKGYFYGLVRPLMDPQKYTNKTISNILHILSTNAKGGAMYERGAFRNQAEAERKWADPSGLIEMEDGALKNGKLVERKPAEYPAGLDKFLSFTLTQHSMVTGLNPEFMGQAGVNQPGVLEAQRKQSGLSILAWFFDAMRAYRKDKARLMLFYIQEYIPEGRLIRVTGEWGAKYVPMALDASAREYDIVLENAPTSPNQKAHTFATLMQMMPMIVKSGIPIPPEVFLYSDLPAPLAHAFAEGIKASRKPDPRKQAMEEQALLADLREKFAKIAKDESQAEYNRARAEEVIASIDIAEEELINERMKVVGELQAPQDVTFN